MYANVICAVACALKIPGREFQPRFLEIPGLLSQQLNQIFLFQAALYLLEPRPTYGVEKCFVFSKIDNINFCLSVALKKPFCLHFRVLESTVVEIIIT